MHVVTWETLLVKVNVFKVSAAIQMILPFPEGDLKQLHQCARTWKDPYLGG